MEALKRASIDLGWTTTPTVYVVGQDGCKTWHDCVRARRSGDVVLLEAVSLIAEPKSKLVPYPAMDMRDAADEIDRRGAVIIEACTMRSTAKPDDRKAMFLDGAKALGQGRALPSHVARENGKRGGRRPKVFTDAEMAKARAVWDSRKYKTYKEAAEHLPKGFSWARAYRLFGPRS